MFHQITPCLWFDAQAEEAARFYCSIFPNSRVTRVSRYTDAGRDIHGKPAGSVLTVDFELDGQAFTALNGGPEFKFSEAVSFQVACESQQEIDRYWQALGAGGDESAQQCGWLKDRYGVSWQIVPASLAGMMASDEPMRSERVMETLLTMKKLDVAALERAFRG